MGNITSNPSELPLAGSQAILVVDDVTIVRRLAYRLLSQAGYRVYEAASAAEALDVLSLADGRLALAVVDALMPQVSGGELVRHIRQRWPEVRVLLMSAHPAEILAQDGLICRTDRFLAKPFTRDELLGVVAAALREEPPQPDCQPPSRRHSPS